MKTFLLFFKKYSIVAYLTLCRKNIVFNFCRMKKILIILFCGGIVFMSSCKKNDTSTSCSSGCQSVQCSSNTQQGNRCQNMTTNCCGKCYLHK